MSLRKQRATYSSAVLAIGIASIATVANAKGIDTNDCFAPPYFDESIDKTQALEIGNCFYNASNFNKNLNLQYAQSWYRFAADLGHPSAKQNLEKTENARKSADGELTPLGATLAGNSDGSIPAWDGGLQAAPESYVNGQPMVNPFENDSPLLEITINNYQEYEQYLSEGHKALLKAYPDTYSLKIYPSRRTANVPQEVQNLSMNNTQSELVHEGNGVENYRYYYPFPKPENAHEVLWNHLLRYRGGSLHREYDQITVQKNGAYSAVRIEEVGVFPEKLVGFDDVEDENDLAYFRQEVLAPSRLTGTILLVHESKDQVKEPRQAWIYNSGQRRIRRAPQIAYDSPGTAADGLRTTDQADMFSGAPNKYDWELVGKQELFVPYNNFELVNPELKHDDLIQKGHMNPEHLRYEKHRVWKIVGKVKEGQRHIYAKRVLYIDEDTWQILVADQYDGKGNLWRVSEGFHVQYYYADTPWVAADAHYDLISKRYLVGGLQNESQSPVKFGFAMNKGELTPAAIRRMGK